MSDFLGDIQKHVARINARNKAVFVNTCSAALESIQDGSSITGSRGQPVGQYGPGYHPGKVGGELRASYQLQFEDENHASISTRELYAESNEDGIARPNGGPYVQRSTVGGRWSVALTRAGIQPLLEAEAAKLP